MSLALEVAVAANGQPPCPTVDFLAPKPVTLTGATRTVLVRQQDGSYTGIETANASPFQVIRAIPHMERQFAACLPHTTVIPAKAVPAPSANPLGAASQEEAWAILDSGNYLHVIAGIEWVVYDTDFTLLSETRFPLLPQPAPGSIFVYNAVALADVNGDGKLDIVAKYEEFHSSVSLGSGGVQIFLGNGDGIFKPGSAVPLNVADGSLAVGDLNRDGIPDIAVTRNAPGTITVLQGRGDGMFGTPSVVFSSNTVFPAAIVIADLNGDGSNDLVFANAPVGLNASISSPAGVGIMLGNANGTFQPPVMLAASFDRFTGATLAVGDVNGDGIADIVTNGVSVLVGDGKGGFPHRRDYVNLASGRVILADFDGDGKTDVLLGSGNPLFLSGSSLTVLFGEGDGRLLGAPLLVTAGYKPGSFGFPTNYVAQATADFNLDGIPDLVSLSGDERLAVSKGTGDGSFQPVFTYDFSSSNYPVSIAATDFNHDGIPDIAVAVAARSSTAPGTIMVFIGKGDGAFESPIFTSASSGILSIAPSDLNGDGKMDLAVLSSTSTGGTPDAMLVYLGKGNGTFENPTSVATGAQSLSFALGDFNGDGKTDVVVASAGPCCDSSAAQLTLLLGTGDGRFSAGTSTPFRIAIPPQGQYGPQYVIASDFNGDGKLDLAVTLQSGRAFSILLGNGNGTFQAPALYPETADSIVAGDFNGDSIVDLFVGRTLLLGNGNGTFRPEVTDLPVFNGPLVTADFNGDGRLDVAGGYLSLGTATLLNLSQPAPPFAIVSGASFTSGPLAPNSIATAFGKHLASGTAMSTSGALPTTLAGTTVSIQDSAGVARSARLFYVSPGQVNFLVPFDVAYGAATVTIKAMDGQPATASAQIAAAAPALFSVGTFGIAAGNTVTLGPGNSQTIQPVFTLQSGTIMTVPIDITSGTVYLTLFGTGFDSIDAAAFSAKIAGLDVPVSYTGPQQAFAGLDQVNILLPKDLPAHGLVAVVLSMGAIMTNAVYIELK